MVNNAILAGVAIALVAVGIYFISKSGGDDFVAADAGTRYEGCSRGCCMTDRGGDCVESTIPCSQRADGRKWFKRFIGSRNAAGALCPNTRAGTDGSLVTVNNDIAVPPADYSSAYDPDLASY